MPSVEYPVWDRTTRWFHWLNVLCVIGLIGVGTVILYAGDLGVSNDGKIGLKTVHVWIGYAFLMNLVWRITWGFIGGPYARWSAVLPGGKGYGTAVRSEARGLFKREPYSYLGHNPIGRIAVTLMLAALTVQGVSGIILAGTDLYMPPFGQFIAEWVAAHGVDPSQVKPYAPETVNQASYEQMRALRDPVIETHLTTYYVLLVLILLHIVAVVITEVRKGGTIISAMFTGRKILSVTPETELRKPPVDVPTAERKTGD
jgi:cytochrome b